MGQGALRTHSLELHMLSIEIKMRCWLKPPIKGLITRAASATRAAEQRGATSVSS